MTTHCTALVLARIADDRSKRVQLLASSCLPRAGTGTVAHAMCCPTSNTANTGLAERLRERTGTSKVIRNQTWIDRKSGTASPSSNSPVFGVQIPSAGSLHRLRRCRRRKRKRKQQICPRRSLDTTTNSPTPTVVLALCWS
jgi:hypothetical protein